MADFDRKMIGKIMADASATLAMIKKRQGLGKARHTNTSQLWTQQQPEEGRVVYANVLGTHNCADIFTKPLNHDAAEGLP